MKRILCSLLSILFVVGIFFSVPMTASAFYSDIKYLGTYEIEEQINPLYKGLIDESYSVNIKPDVYYSDGLDDFDASLYSSDKEVSATVIREGMEDRLSTVTVYYKTNERLTEATANTLFSELQELAFKETDIATQGDSLRLGYKSSSAAIEGVSDGTYCYYKYIISYEYYTTAAQEAELTREVEEVIANFGFTETTTERAKTDTIYRYITNNVTYDNENLNNESYYLKFTPYAALINKTAVCQGYALLYYRLAEEAGLDSRVITGTSLAQNHAWNIVKLGEYYYYLDSTWDAGKSAYAYYLKGKNDFYNHKNESRFDEETFIKQYPISPSYAQDASFTGVDGDFEYLVYNGVTSITKYTGNAENVVVPATVNGYKVYSVGRLAFNNNTIKTITFSECIKALSNETMYHCDNLETINIPSTMDWTVPRYNSDAITYTMYGVGPIVCKKMKTINLAENNPYMKLVDGILYSADMEVLIYCPPQYQKSVITIPNGVKEITGSAFEECENIKEIKLPSSLLYIGYWAFNNCFNLEKCDLSANVEVIGQYAFQNTKVKTIHIPASMKLFVPGAYGSCLIEKITVNENNETFYVQNDALCSGNTLILCAGSNGKSEYVVPSNIVTISPQAFQEAQFKKITLNSGLKYIDSFAFANAKVKDLVIPDGVLEIGDAALQCGGLTTLIIPDSVIEIASNAIESTNTTTLFYYYSTNSKAYEYFTSNGFKCMPITEFKCGNGHKFERNDHETYYEMICSVCGGLEKLVSKKDMYHSKIELVKEQIVLGVDKKPQIKSVTYEGVELVEGVDYIVEEPSMDIIGYNLIYIQGIGDYYGRQSAFFELIKGTLSTPIATTKNTAKGITVTWGAVENAEKYIVYQRVYNKTTKKYSGWKAIKTTTDLTYTDTTVKLGTKYSYTVKAVTGSVKSGIKTTSGLTYNVTPTVKVAVASNGIKVSWSTAANATGYTVYSSTYNTKTKKWSGWTNRGTTKANATSWVDKKAKSGTKYRYTVKAMNDKVGSTYNKDGAATLYLAQPTVKIANNASGVKIAWNKIAGATGYTIYRAEYKNGKWSGWKNMGTIKKNSTVSWVDKSAKSGTQYRYTVRAINGSVKSTYKASNSLIYLAQPAVSFANASNGMKVSWKAIPGATGYTVYSATYNAKTKKWSGWSKRGTTTKTSWTDTKVTSGTYYKYTVKAINGKVTSTYMATSGLIRLAQPTVKSASASNGIKVSWNKIAGAKKYTVYRSELQNGVWSSWVNKGTLANTVFSWTDKSVTKGSTYRYTVRAINNKAGSSYAASNSVVVSGTTTATITSSNVKTQFLPLLCQYHSLYDGRHDVHLAGYTDYKNLLSESWYQQNDPYHYTSALYKFKSVKSQTELKNAYKGYLSAKLVDNYPFYSLVTINGTMYYAYNNAVGMCVYDVNSIKYKGTKDGGYLVSVDYYNSGNIYYETQTFLVKNVNGKLIIDSIVETTYEHDYDYQNPKFDSIINYYK